MTTRDEVMEFNAAFRLTARTTLTELSEDERLLRGKLLLEEVLEHIISGLGLELSYGLTHSGTTIRYLLPEKLKLRIDPDIPYNPIETADGLGDINYIIHGTALTMGIDLDAVTTEIHKSNMSKLDENGKPIINGETVGYREVLGDGIHAAYEAGYRHDLPHGKVIKGPNYQKPDIAKVIGL